MVRICDLVENYPRFDQLAQDVTAYFKEKSDFNDVQVILQ